MKKPILIDALHICMGGGLMILNHRVSHLVERNVNFVLLKDERCPALHDEAKVQHIRILSSDNHTRKEFYKATGNDFSKVLCFGNIPPQIKLSVPVYTYLHNVSLLKIPTDYSFRSKLKTFLKKYYIKHLSSNTDAWIVQTSNTAQLVRDNLVIGKLDVLQFPFYSIPEGLNSIPREKRADYCFIGDHTCAKGHEYLVEAWIKLANMGITPTLHLTVSEPVFLPAIKNAQDKGAKIINHGKVPFAEVIRIYNQSKAIVYPSLNESLGLGIVEGIEAGCDIIGSDLPYLHSVCKASGMFKPRDSESIVEAILSYEQSDRPSSHLLIKDMVNEFIDFLIR